MSYICLLSLNFNLQSWNGINEYKNKNIEKTSLMVFDFERWISNRFQWFHFCFHQWPIWMSLWSRHHQVHRTNRIRLLHPPFHHRESRPAWMLISPSTTIQKFFVQTPDPYYCRYCNVRCNGHIQLEKHCSSEEHITNINSDSDRQWNYNPPPWNFPDGQYQLCQKWGIYLFFQFVWSVSIQWLIWFKNRAEASVY